MNKWPIVVIIILLLVIIFFVYKMNELSKALSSYTSGSHNKSEKSSRSEESYEEGTNKKGRKSRMKHKHNWVLKIFNDETPRTSDELLQEYNKNQKAIKKTELTVLLKWLEKNNYLKTEDTDELGVIYGLNAWFDEEEGIKDEYIKNIKILKSTK